MVLPPFVAKWRVRSWLQALPGTCVYDLQLFDVSAYINCMAVMFLYSNNSVSPLVGLYKSEAYQRYNKEVET
jgi:hypothetical protein